MLSSSIAKINNFFQTLKYGKMAVITPREMGLLAHTSFAQNVISVSDDTALIISKHSKELSEPLSTAIRAIPKGSTVVSDDALNVIGRVRTKQMKQGAAGLAASAASLGSQNVSGPRRRGDGQCLSAPAEWQARLVCWAGECHSTLERPLAR